MDSDIVDGLLFGPTPPSPLAAANSYTGPCHCGAITYSCVLTSASHVLCHCRTCQKLGGGLYSCNWVIPKADLNITQGAPSVYTYTGASGNIYFRSLLPLLICDVSLDFDKEWLTAM